MRSEEALEACSFIDLTDSFVLSFESHAKQYWLRVLFALMPQHRDYSPPAAGEYACYRHGWLKMCGVRNVSADWSGHPASFEPDGEVDFGTIDRLEFVDEVLICEGDWGKLRIACDSLAVELDR